MTDYETTRALRDVQSRISSIDDALFNLTGNARANRPGRKLVLQVCSQLAHLVGAEQRAERFDKLVERAASAPAQTTVAGWAAELTSLTVPDFILSISHTSAWAGVLARCPQVSVLGHSSAKVPIAGAAPPATIVAEGAPIPVRKGAFSPLTLTAFKLAAIMTITEELARSTNIEPAVRTLLSQSIGAGMDSLAFAATGTGSVIQGGTVVTASTATPLETAMRQDFEQLIRNMDHPSANVAFVMHPCRAAFATSVLEQGFAYPILVSSTIGVATVVAVDCAGVAAAMAGDAKILLSESAAIHEDDVPTALSASASPNTVAAPIRGLFQTDAIGLRIIAPMGWAARTGSVTYIATVTW
jgi:hypothetical protein